MATDPTKAFKKLSKTQAKVAQGFAEAGRPAQTKGAGQITDILKTGGVGATVPAIESMQTQYGAANRQAQMQIGEALGRLGIGGPPAESILQGMNIESGAMQNQAIAQLLAPIFQQALGLGVGLPAIGAQGVGQAAATKLGTPEEGAHLAGLAPLAGALGQLVEMQRTGKLQPFLQSIGMAQTPQQKILSAPIQGSTYTPAASLGGAE